MLFKQYCYCFIYSDYKEKYNKYKKNYIENIYYSNKKTINFTLNNYFKSNYNYDFIKFLYKNKNFELINCFINKDKNNLVIYFYLLYKSQEDYSVILEKIKKEYYNLDLSKFKIKNNQYINKFTYIDYINQKNNFSIDLIILYIKFKYILNEIDKKKYIDYIIKNKTIN